MIMLELHTQEFVQDNIDIEQIESNNITLLNLKDEGEIKFFRFVSIY